MRSPLARTKCLGEMWLMMHVAAASGLLDSLSPDSFVQPDVRSSSGPAHVCRQADTPTQGTVTALSPPPFVRTPTERARGAGRDEAWVGAEVVIGNLGCRQLGAFTHLSRQGVNLPYARRMTAQPSTEAQQMSPSLWTGDRTLRSPLTASFRIARSDGVSKRRHTQHVAERNACRDQPLNTCE